MSSVAPETRCPRCQAPSAASSEQSRWNGKLQRHHSVNCAHCGLVQEADGTGLAAAWLRAYWLRLEGCWQAHVVIAERSDLKRLALALANTLELPTNQLFQSLRQSDQLFVGTRTEVEWLALLAAQAGVAVVIERCANAEAARPALWIDGTVMRLSTERAEPPQPAQTDFTLPAQVATSSVLVGYVWQLQSSLLSVLQPWCDRLLIGSGTMPGGWVPLDGPVVTRSLSRVEADHLNAAIVAAGYVMPDPEGLFNWQPESGDFLDIDIMEVTGLLHAHQARGWDVRGNWSGLLYWNFPRFVVGLFRAGDSIPPGDGCFFDKYTRRIHTARYIDIKLFLRRQPEGVLDSLLFRRLTD